MTPSPQKETEIHLHFNIFPLLCLTSREFKEEYGDVFLDADGVTIEAEKAREMLFELYRNGQKVVVIGNCTNYDTLTGCRGCPVGDK